MSLEVSNRNSVPQKTTTKDKVVKTGANLLGVGIASALPTMTIADTFRLQSPEELRNGASAMQAMMPDFDTFENTAKNIKQILKDTGLEKKGVKFNAIDGSAQSQDLLNGIINKEIKSNNPIAARLKKAYNQTFSNGLNAAFFPASNDIVVNKNNLYMSAYHEAGHAMNFNGNFARKALVFGRNLTPMGVSLVAPIAIAVGLLHHVDKDKPKEEKGKLERTADFISNNAGKLTLASYVPMVAEEGLASVNGIKQAKKFLNPEQISKLKLGYAKAWGTYAATAALISAGVALGVKVAKVIKNKNAQKQEKVA